MANKEKCMESGRKSYRDIIEIDEDLCDGCGRCVSGCAEGALIISLGKARLVKDDYCDGLGACLGHCPAGALKVTKRHVPPFDFDAAMMSKAERAIEEIPSKAAFSKATGWHSDRSPGPPASPRGDFRCPGSEALSLVKPPALESPKVDLPKPSPWPTALPEAAARAEAMAGSPAFQGGEFLVGGPSLASWPIQIRLVPPEAPFLDSPVLIVAADCTAFASPTFHRDFLGKGLPLVNGCPKLDDSEAQISKLCAILKAHPTIGLILLPMMTLPCCQGLYRAAVEARGRSGREDLVIRPFTVSPEGQTFAD
jgi:ferredoxin